MSPTVKVSPAVHDRLKRLADEIQAREGRPVSLNDVLDRVLGAPTGDRPRPSPLDFAGAVEMTDDEAARIRGELDALWGSWAVG